MVAIAEHLTFAEKLKLAHVCKFCHEKLSNNTLYKKFIFKKLDKFNQAVDFFNKQEDTVKKTVRDFKVSCIDQSYMEITVQLSALFPKVTSLEWLSDLDRSRHVIDRLAEPAYVEDLHKWKGIECLKDYTWHLDIADDALKSTYCNALARLEARFGEEAYVFGTPVRVQHISQELINHFHNAPSLQDVNFIYAAIRLVDFDKLHKNLPKLKNFILESALYYLNDRIDMAGI